MQMLRLELDSGFPWETVFPGIEDMRVFHSDASIWQRFAVWPGSRLLSFAIAVYYRWRPWTFRPGYL